MNCEGWSSGVTKLGWVVQIEQPATAARWVSGLGMRQLMAAWVLGSKMGLSRVCVGSGVMAWVAASRRDGPPTFSVSSRPSLFFLFFFSFFFSFVFVFSVWFWSLIDCWVFFFFFFLFIIIIIIIIFYINIFLRFSLALEISWAGRLG